MAPRSITLMIDGIEYVAVPKSKYLSLTKETELPGGAVDALAFADSTIATNLRKAREVSGLTQAELAAKLGRSQSLVARAERGGLQVGADYVKSVLKACGLPAGWTPGQEARRRRRKVA